MTHAQTNDAVRRSLLLADSRADRRDGPKRVLPAVVPVVVAPGHVFVIPTVTERVL